MSSMATADCREKVLYYDIPSYRNPVPSLEVETDLSWHATGQFVNIAYPQGISGVLRLAVDL